MSLKPAGHCRMVWGNGACTAQEQEECGETSGKSRGP